MKDQSSDDRKRDSMQGKPEYDRENRSSEDRVNDLQKALNEIKRDHTKLVDLASQLEEFSGGVEYKFELLMALLSEELVSPRSGRSIRKRIEELVGRRAKMLEAETGANSLELQFLTGGHVLLRIDSGECIDLSWRPAQLLDILTTDLAAGPAGLMKWLPMNQIVLELQLDPQNKKDRHNVRNLVYLVRKMLKQHESNPFYLQTNPKYGIRFAVRPEFVTKHKVINKAV